MPRRQRSDNHATNPALLANRLLSVPPPETNGVCRVYSTIESTSSISMNKNKFIYIFIRCHLTVRLQVKILL